MTKSRGIRPQRGSVVQFFYDNLYIEVPDCKVWPYGTAGQNHYGVVFFGGKPFYVHQLACQAWNGPRPPGVQASHGPCHNTRCWNGAHLTWETPPDNNRNKLRDGTATVGERNAMARLTTAAVLEIRRLCAEGVQRDGIAAQFGVHRMTIDSVAARRTWAHVQ